MRRRHRRHTGARARTWDATTSSTPTTTMIWTMTTICYPRWAARGGAREEKDAGRVDRETIQKHPKGRRRRDARAREDANEDEDVRIDVANGSTKRKRPTGEVDSDDDERPFVRRLKELERKRGALRREKGATVANGAQDERM